MATSEKKRRACSNGHIFYKSSDCPICPTCEQEYKPESEFLSLLSAPARRALVHDGITSLQKLSEFSEKEVLKLHGLGPASLPTLRASLEEEGLTFRN